MKGLPYENGGDTGRIGLDIYRKDSNIVYAIVQHEKGGTYRSEDKGETWKKMGDTNPRPSYYSQIRIDPNNDLRIWELGAQMYYSEDGGKTFATQRVKGIHGDFHAMWIDPADSNHVITGCDGGFTGVTTTGGRGISSTRSRLDSITKSDWTTKNPTKSAGDCRTTEAGAGRACLWRAMASRMRIGR